MIPAFYGTAQSYASKQALVTKWNMKKAGKPIFQTKGNLTLNVAETVEAEQKKQKLNSIKAKLKSGMRLSNQELAYLKENNPQLYEKVMDSYREREAYKKKLEKCKTKDEVSRLQTETLSQIASELSSAASNPNIPEGKKAEIAETIQMRISALQNEHTSFVGSTGYARLKWEYELDREEKAREKKARAVKVESAEEESYVKKEEKPDISTPSTDFSGEEAPGPPSADNADNSGDNNTAFGGGDNAEAGNFADTPPVAGNPSPPDTNPSAAAPKAKPSHPAATVTALPRKAFIARA